MRALRRVVAGLGRAAARLGRDIRDCRMALVCLLFYFLLAAALFHAFCPMVILCGVPCPGCGMTRAVFYLLCGKFRLSFGYHPLAGGWVLLGLWFVYRRYLLGKKVTGAKQCAGLLFAGMAAVYIYRMMTVFPGPEPMAYRADNLLSQAFRQMAFLLGRGDLPWKGP